MQQDRDKPSGQPEPWHRDDEKTSTVRRGGAPIGTHSFTDKGPETGMPAAPQADAGAERSRPRDEPPGTPEPDPLLEPRANLGRILGNKP